jgi:hypothetical protein
LTFADQQTKLICCQQFDCDVFLSAACWQSGYMVLEEKETLLVDVADVHVTLGPLDDVKWLDKIPNFKQLAMESWNLMDWRGCKLG